MTLEVYNCTLTISRSSNPVLLPFLGMSRSLRGLFKSQISGSYPNSFQFSKSGGWGRARETCLFNKSQAVPAMLVQGPHFENH